MQKHTSNFQRGTSLIETLIATFICAIAVFSLAGLVAMATKQSKNMGSTAAQAISLAAQKMDQLMILGFLNSQLDVSPLTSLTCDPVSSCNASYIDFLDANSVLLGSVTPATAAANPAVFFTRRWLVASPTATLKSIQVRVEGKVVGSGLAPSATVACLKAAL